MEQGPETLWLPAVIARAGERASRRFVEYFAAEIRNPQTRRAYATAVGRFLAWCDARGVALEQLQPVVVAEYVEGLGRELAGASVRQHLAAVRMIFDYLVVGQVLDYNPAASVRGPRLVIRTDKTPVLEDTEARALLASIAGEDLADRRDKALLAVMLYSFARVGAIVRLRVRDYEHQRCRAYLVLREKGGQHRRLPVHSRAAAALDAYLEAARIGGTPDAPLFQAFASKRAESCTGRALTGRSVLRIVKRRAAAAGIGHDLGCHSCRATGITSYLVHGGTLERAAAIAGHISTRTTQLYDRRREQIEPEEIERVQF